MKAILISKNSKVSYSENKLKIGDTTYLPNEIDFTDVFLDRIDGYISLKALRFLSKSNISLHVSDYSGVIMGSYANPSKNNGRLKIQQIKAFETRRESIARAILNSKIDAQHTLLLQLSKRYPISTDFKPIGKRLLTIEGSYAGFYFNQLSSVFNALYPQFRFIGRNNKSHNMKSLDPINSMLNYAYGIILAVTKKLINQYGLLMDISFLHEPTENKPTLAFDLMELLRPVGDLAVIQTLESKKLSWKDFVYSELSNCRLMPGAQCLLIGNLQILLNRMIEGKQIETIHKANVKELADAIISKRAPKFKVVIPELYGQNEVVLKLQNMTIEERKKLGIRKNTLWYIQKQIKEGKNPKIYQKVAEKLTR